MKPKAEDKRVGVARRHTKSGVPFVQTNMNGGGTTTIGMNERPEGDGCGDVRGNVTKWVRLTVLKWAHNEILRWRGSVSALADDVVAGNVWWDQYGLTDFAAM